MTIGERIKNRRNILGLTQDDVAKKIGVALQTIFKYENGIISNIPVEKVEKLAKALQTTPEYLLGWETDFMDDDDAEIIEWAKKLPPYEKIPSKFKAIELLLVFCGFELKFCNNRYAIFYDDGFVEIPEDELEKIQNDVLNFLDFNVKKYISAQINNDNICIDMFSEINQPIKKGKKDNGV